MKPPGKSTLFRMQRTVLAEQERLEASDARLPHLVRKRDDFAGIVRLIDIILSDQALIQGIKARMGTVTVLATDTDVEVAE